MDPVGGVSEASRVQARPGQAQRAIPHLYMGIAGCHRLALVLLVLLEIIRCKHSTFEACQPLFGAYVHGRSAGGLV